MSEHSSSTRTLFYALYPSVILLAIDFFCTFIQPQAIAISHLGLGVLIAQMLSLWLFGKAQMCPGQQGRLRNMNKGFLLFWLVWLFFSGFTNYHYVPTDFIALCGVAITFCLWFVPKNRNDVKPYIFIGLLIGAMAVITYFAMFVDLSLLFLPMFSPFAQLILGLVLLHLTLRSARNRLDNFMATLSLTSILALLLNAIVVLSVLWYAYAQGVNFPNPMAWAVYFAIHLLIAAVLGFVLLKGVKIDYFILLLVFLVVASLPVWAGFAYI